MLFVLSPDGAVLLSQHSAVYLPGIATGQNHHMELGGGWIFFPFILWHSVTVSVWGGFIPLFVVSVHGGFVPHFVVTVHGGSVPFFVVSVHSGFVPLFVVSVHGGSVRLFVCSCVDKHVLLSDTVTVESVTAKSFINAG